MTERIIELRAPFGALFGKTPEEVFGALPTPCYILDEGQLKRNGEILARVENATGCRILLAQKAFSNYDLYPVLAEYLSGTEASGLFEARLGKLQSCLRTRTILCSTPWDSCRSSEPGRRLPERVWDCV